jgi:hypothetical protein
MISIEKEIKFKKKNCGKMGLQCFQKYRNKAETRFL